MLQLFHPSTLPLAADNAEPAGGGTLSQLFDPNTWGLPHYIALAGIAVVLVALIVYFLGGSRVRMPAIAGSSLGCLALGLGIGLVTMMSLGYRWTDPRMAGAEESGSGGRGGGGGEGGARGGGGAVGGSAPRMQLASLIMKLDVLMEKPIQPPTEQQKKQVRDELARVAAAGKDLKDDEARKALKVLHEAFEADKGKLVAAGYPWPGERPPPAINPPAPTNPLTVDPYPQHLTSLQKRMGKGG